MNDSASPGRFGTTHWSVVLAARGYQHGASRDAMAQLCQAYWLPVYAFVRRHVANVADAQDLTQEFFVRLLEKDYLARADQQYGRFRTFLLTAVQRFLSKERMKARAQKRGGGKKVLSLDFAHGERQWAPVATDNVTAEQEFDRQWARQLLETVVSRLRAEYAEGGRQHVFDQLKPLMIKDTDADSYEVVAQRLGITIGAAKTAVYRMRKRYCDLLRSEIAQTVCRAEDVQDELQQLFEALG
jgi:RNA polymerase sigma-70 factor (ECF subfamily)